MKHLFLISLCTLFSFYASAQNSSKQQDVRQLIVMSEAAKTAVAATSAFFDNIEKTQPNIPAEFWTKVRSKLNEEEFIQMYIPIFDKHYTHAEVKELIKFYKTPIGKKMIEVTPAIMQESMKAGEEWGAKIAQETMLEMQNGSAK